MSEIFVLNCIPLFPLIRLRLLTFCNCLINSTFGAIYIPLRKRERDGKKKRGIAKKPERKMEAGQKCDKHVARAKTKRDY